MGRNNQQRRAAKARHRQRVRAGSSADQRIELDERVVWAGQQVRDEAFSFLQRAARLAAAGSRPDLLGQWLTVQLEPLNSRVRREAEGLLTAELTARVTHPLTTGWEPRDLLHVAGRVHQRVAILAEDLIVHHGRTSRSSAALPSTWIAQVAALDDRGPDWTWCPVGDDGDVTRLARSWADALALIKLLAELVPLESAAAHASQRSPASTRDADRDRLLHRVRSLLAKAEATQFAAEAEAFTAKAQQLMSRHAIDDAMLRSERDEVVDVISRRVHLQAPYAAVKASLLNATAEPNRCRVVLHPSVDIATVVGTPLAVEQVEMLFTSLLVQATRAMAEAGRRPGSYDRSSSFRRSFLMSYAIRIGERLEEADAETSREYSSDLVPILRREAEAVSAEYRRLFPHATPGRGTRFDARGWSAGRAAAERATIVAGRLGA